MFGGGPVPVLSPRGTDASVTVPPPLCAEVPRGGGCIVGGWPLRVALVICGDDLFGMCQVFRGFPRPFLRAITFPVH